MSREQWNVTYAVCFIGTIALAYAVSGPAAALAVFFLPPLLIVLWMNALGRLGIDWDRRPRKDMSSPRQPKQPPEFH